MIVTRTSCTHPLGRRRLAGVAVASLSVAALVAGCGAGSSTPPTISSSNAASSAGQGASPTASASTTSTAASGSTATTPQSEGADDGAQTASPGNGVTADDRQAGVLSMNVPQKGDGKLSTVPGSQPAPAAARRTINVAVQVEGGLDINPGQFAGFVLSTLNDPRSWTADGYTFARTDNPATATVTVVLASPDTSAALYAAR